MYIRFLLATVITIVSAYTPAAAGLKFVAADTAAATGAWSSASPNLQGVIYYSVPGDTICVAAGTYYTTGTTDRAVEFNPRDGVTMLGGFSGTEDSITAAVIAARDFIANETVLSAEIGNPDSYFDNSYHVMYLYYASPNGGPVVDGFTITGGYANGSTTSGMGAGILIRGIEAGTIATLRNLVFVDNHAGGGLTCYPSASGRYITLRGENLRFANNGGGAGLGAGVGYLDATLVNCSFASSVTVTTGINISSVGHVKADIINCTFAGRGGILAPYFTSGTQDINVYNSIIANNNYAGYTDSTSFRNCNVVTSGGSAAWALAKGVDLGGNIDADAGIIDAQNDNGVYRLASSSPCINRGDTTGLALPETDITGSPRVMFDTLDMGAYEFQGPFLPVITTTAGSLTLTTMAGSGWTAAITAADRDGGTFSFGLGTAPAAMAVDTAAGTLAWTPVRADYGQHPVTVYVYDAGGIATDSLSFTLTVNVVNSAPVIGTRTDDVLRLAFLSDSMAVHITIEASDPDSDAIRFTLTQGPSGMEVDSLTGVVSFTPASYHPFSNPYTVQVRDPFGLTANFSHTMYVRATNSPPAFWTYRPNLDTVITVGDAWTASIRGSDPDNQPTLAHSYFCADSMNGFTYTADLGDAAWTPGLADTGTYNVSFYLSDGGRVQDTFAVTLVVLPVAAIGPEAAGNGIPAAAFAYAAAPGGRTTLTYATPAAAEVAVNIYATDGTLIREPVNRIHRPGTYCLALDGTGLPAGRYLCRVTIGNGYSAVLPVLLLD